MSRPVTMLKLTERAIRNSLTDLQGLTPAERYQVLKLAIDFVKMQHKIDEADELGRGFEDQEKEDQDE